MFWLAPQQRQPQVHGSAGQADIPQMQRGSPRGITWRSYNFAGHATAAAAAAMLAVCRGPDLNCVAEHPASVQAKP